jgi:hypothetical protein
MYIANTGVCTTATMHGLEGLGQSLLPVFLTPNDIVLPDPIRAGYFWQTPALNTFLRDLNTYWIDAIKPQVITGSCKRILYGSLSQSFQEQDQPTFLEQFLGFQRIWEYPNDRAHAKPETYVMIGLCKNLTPKDGFEFFEEELPACMKLVNKNSIKFKDF